MDKLMDGPLGFVEDCVNMIFFDPLEELGAIFMCLFVLLVGVGIGMSIMIISRMM